ncbi:DUF1810 domain-containing protein [Jannaschia formosa]|uniref:DUF1810 domain-containing protein n=1 Tax=Jannaschia formosa TaxID=2259592 RepID=UPI000E1BB2EB|nr:DUF1810 domain-containing protein [Jannaschia formosa]TFL19860.1 DUF1810 domain-containing protein [Jannaschia formosa]
MPDLSRFHDAQADTYATALAELRAGRKRSHWMWFVFPQVAGLGRSPTARHYAIADLAEARAFLADPVLGPRLEQAARALLAHAPPAEAILGGIDAMKLRSSMTLFREAGADFAQPVLDRFFGGDPDPATLDLLGA